MKFLIDECVGRSIAQWLRDNGYDTVTITDISPGSQDIDVLDKALLEYRVLITFDKDFGDIIFRDNRVHSGIVLLRLTSHTLDNKIKVLKALFRQHAHELSNNFIVVTEQSIRIIRTKH